MENSIYELMARAEALRHRTQAESVSPEDVGGLDYDTLGYILSLEMNAASLGIRKVYRTADEMLADTEPVGFNGKLLRLGQLVTVYDRDTPEAEHNGEIYAFTAPGWKLVSKIDAAYVTQDGLNGVIPCIDVKDIDTFPASLSEAAAMAKDTAHARRTLTAVFGQKTIVTVGILDMFSDNMGHMLTQVLTTHYKMNSDGVLDLGAHTDDKIYTYFRSYHISGGTSAIPEGTWGAWKLIYDSDTMTLIDKILDIDMLTADDKGVAGGVATLGDDGKIPPEQLPDVMPPAYATVLMFHGTVSGVAVEMASLAKPVGIYYDTSSKCFVATDSRLVGQNTKYYSNWAENKERFISVGDDYGEYTINGRKPSGGRLYVNTSGKKVCWWDGESLTWDGSSSPGIREMTDEEIDKIVAKLLEVK